MSLIKFSGEVKSLGDGRFGGYLIRFGDENNTDLEGDFFATDTDLGQYKSLPLMYNHGMDKTLKCAALKSATGESIMLTHVKTDDIGLWYEAQVNLANAYQAKINDLVIEGKLGFSSGAAGHTVVREPVGKAFKIAQWFLSEGSLTPTPAEPQNIVEEVKSVPLGELDIANSLSRRVSNIREAFYRTFPDIANTYYYCVEVFDNAVLFEMETYGPACTSAYYAVAFTQDQEGAITFGNEFIEYKRQITWNKVESKALKSGLKALGKSEVEDEWDEVRQLIKQIEGK